MRVIQGAGAVIDGAADRISGIRVLGPYRLRDPAREAGRRLHGPADDALLLPDPPEHIRGRDRPPGRLWAVLLRRADRQPADRARAQPVLPRRPPRERRPDRLDARHDPPGTASRRSRTDRADLCGEPGAPRTAYRALAEKYGLNRPGGRLFVRPALGAWFIAFNHDRPAFDGPGQIPLKKAINYAIDRPELTRALRWPRRQAHGPDASTRVRASGEHLPTRRRRSSRCPPLVRAGAASSPRSSSSMHGRSLQP